jgi:hypothetical protein
VVDRRHPLGQPQTGPAGIAPNRGEQPSPLKLGNRVPRLPLGDAAPAGGEAASKGRRLAGTHGPANTEQKEEPGPDRLEATRDRGRVEADPLELADLGRKPQPPDCELRFAEIAAAASDVGADAGERQPLGAAPAARVEVVVEDLGVFARPPERRGRPPVGVEKTAEGPAVARLWDAESTG